MHLILPLSLSSQALPCKQGIPRRDSTNTSEKGRDFSPSILSGLLWAPCDTTATTTTTTSKTMPLLSSPISPPLPAQSTIGRSRSRYKGPRLQKTLINPPDSPIFSADHIQQSDNLGLSPPEPRPQYRREVREGSKIQPSCHETMRRRRESLDDTQRSDAFVYQQHDSSRKAKDRTHLQDKLVSPLKAPQGYQQVWQRSRYRAEAEAESVKEASQDTVPKPKVATSPEQCSRIPRSDLCSPREKETTATIRSPTLSRGGDTNPIAGHWNEKCLHKGRNELKRTISAHLAIDSNQNIAKPAFDAPVSAVNAGERWVKVLCDQNLTSFPVTPSTTPLDIIHSATDQSTEFIDSTGTILFESFKQLGLERPLRRYEHIRDVLNSWDNDTQNTLVIKPSHTFGEDNWPDLHSVSASPLVDTSVYIHYSQRPGHWDKRWVTLRSDGQMLVAKREGGETANICHMSDFDIYIPTARQSAKRIKPPRKICFAVKSQQKSSMFLSTANFVHFFSTSDKTLAATWYKAVLEWRSWYLVNVMGEGPQGPENLSSKKDNQNVLQIGSFELESQGRLPQPPSEGIRTRRTSRLARNDTKHLASPTKSDSWHNVAGNSLDDVPIHSRGKSHPSQSKKITKSVAETSASRDRGPTFKQVVRSEEPEPFAAAGLLGRTYTQRQNVQREREKVQRAGSDQSVATPNVNPVNQIDRTLSQHPKPKPLIDLTPQYQEPPQHVKKGRGVILEQIPAGGLVEVANTPEAAIAIPPSTTWRRPTNRGEDEPSVGRSRTVQRDYSRGLPSNPKQKSISPEKGEHGQ